MDATPTTASTRSARGKSAAKAKPESLETSAKPARRRKTAAKQPDTPVTESIDLTQTIATTAYFLAAGRNFEPGHELEDWLEAERRVRAAQ